MEKDFTLIKELDDLIGVKEHRWYGHEDETDKSLMHDTGKGEPIVIRRFEFKLNPTLEKPPTKEQILTPEYIKHIQTLLWADSLRMVMEPQCVIDKTSMGIFVLCQARTGAVITEEPKLLQEWMK